MVQASLTLPEGWKQASALPVAAQNASTVSYGPVSLETLVDSPIYAGANVRRIELDAPGTTSPVDWRTFLRDCLDAHENGTLLEGLRHSGRQLAWSAKRSEFAGGDESDELRIDDFAWSLGVNLKRDGTVDSVLWDSPAFRSDINKFEQIVAVNGAAYSPERLNAAIGASPNSTTPIELLLKDGDRYRMVRVDYHGGLRYPRLERIADRPELLDSKVLAPKT